MIPAKWPLNNRQTTKANEREKKRRNKKRKNGRKTTEDERTIKEALGMRSCVKNSEIQGVSQEGTGMGKPKKPEADMPGVKEAIANQPKTI
jgi:hypothetical protein